jgi:hypothetical protein
MQNVARNGSRTEKEPEGASLDEVIRKKCREGGKMSRMGMFSVRFVGGNGFLSDPLPGMDSDPLPGMISDPLPGMDSDPLPGMISDPLPG